MTIDPLGSNPVSPVVGGAADAASATSAALVQPRAAPIGRGRIVGALDWGNKYSGSHYFHGVPLFGMGASTSRGAQTILRQGYRQGIPLDRGMSPLGTILEGHKPWADFKSRPFATAGSWFNRETYGARTLVTRAPQSFTRFDSTNIFNVEHENLYWNPWQLSTHVNLLGKHFPGMQGQDPLTPGASSILSASSSIFRQGINPTSLGGVKSTIAEANPEYSEFLQMHELNMTSGDNAAYALLGADKGMISSRAAGLFAGAKAGTEGTTVPAEVLSSARATSLGGANFANTAEWATGVSGGVREAGGVFKYASAAGGEGGILTRSGMQALGEGGLVKGGAAGLEALPLLGNLALVGQAFAVGSMAGKLLTKPFHAGINLAEDSIKSFKGSINKPVFGMGFRPTEATLTARQRGVTAIQNSRLNARSWLGTEASSMWGHFG